MMVKCDLAHCKEEAEWLVMNILTGKSHKMCHNHSIWYTISRGQKGISSNPMRKEARL